MKAKKALRRLAKIEASMSKVRDEYSASASNLENIFQQATAAIARAKEAVSLEVSSGTKAASAKADRVVKKATPSQKTAAVRKVAGSAPRTKTAKKKTPGKNAATKTATAPVVQAATKTAAI